MQNVNNDRTNTPVRAEIAEARTPGARPSTGSGRTERKKLSLKFGG